MEANSITGRVGRLDISYDRDADVLYIEIDRPQAGDTFDTERGFAVTKGSAYATDRRRYNFALRNSVQEIAESFLA